MIITTLKGGLGNQLFQYAAALSLARRIGGEVLLDTSFLEINDSSYTKRNFELFQFPVIARVAERSFVDKIKSRPLYRRIFSRTVKPVLVNESNILTVSGNKDAVYLVEGYFQSEKFFTDVRQELLSSLTDVSMRGPEFDEQKEQVTGTLSVAVHVRRGDYVNLASARQFHGLCGIDYFIEAMNYFSGNFSGVVFYVFSDDIRWCRENFPADKDIVFSGTTHSYSGADMLLMSNCRHNIISNSSYSWWSAWLNQNKDQVVIAPKKWYADSKMINNEIYCRNWKLF